MSENLESKKQLVSELKEQLSNAKSMVFVDYRGITVAEDTELRRNFRNENITYKVFKNRLLMRALDEMGITGYDAKNFEGTTAVAFGEDETAPARIFCETKDKIRKMAVKFGIVNGEIMDANQMEALAKIPSKPVLVAMLMGMLQAPTAAFARALNEIAKTKAE